MKNPLSLKRSSANLSKSSGWLLAQTGLKFYLFDPFRKVLEITFSGFFPEARRIVWVSTPLFSPSAPVCWVSLSWSASWLPRFISKRKEPYSTGFSFFFRAGFFPWKFPALLLPPQYWSWQPFSPMVCCFKQDSAPWTFSILPTGI